MVQDKAKRIITNFTDILKSPEMQILPGQIAFYFVMSIIPIATISGVVASLIIENFNFVDTVNSVLPKALATIFTSLSTDLHIQGIAFVLVLYLLLGSNAPGSIIIASNIFYEVEQPNYIKVQIFCYDSNNCSIIVICSYFSTFRRYNSQLYNYYI